MLSERGFDASPVYNWKSTPLAAAGEYATKLLSNVPPRWANRYHCADCGATAPEKCPSVPIGVARAGVLPCAATACGSRGPEHQPWPGVRYLPPMRPRDATTDRPIPSALL
jgi:hypothetical protein